MNPAEKISIPSHRQQTQEIRNNSNTFQREILKELPATSFGGYLLMRKKKQIKTYRSLRLALIGGNKQFKDRVFSVHKISK